MFLVYFVLDFKFEDKLSLFQDMEKKEDLVDDGAK